MNNKGIPKVRLLIFYTTNKKPKISLKDDKNFIEMIDTLEVFLTDFDSDEIKKDVFGKINAGKKLKPEDLMKLIIFPMTYESKKKKVKAITETLEIISKINDVDDFSFSLLGVTVFANQIIIPNDLEKAKEMLDMMTQMDKLYKKQYDKEYKEKFIKEKQKFEQNYTRKVVINMVEKGFETDTISEIMTDVPKKDIEQIIEELKKNNN